MSETVIKLPDIGEGIAEAEISEWMVGVGDWIREDDTLGVVLTDKAAVEIPSSVSGKVLWLAGEPGDMLAIGAPLVKIETADESDAEAADETTHGGEADRLEQGDEADEGAVADVTAQPEPATTAAAPMQSAIAVAAVSTAASQTRARVLAAPAVRGRARDLGIDIATVPASGPEGRVTHADLDRHLLSQGAGAALRPADGVTETRIIGLRRKIAEQMTLANAHIPQITIVEELDVTELERLRARMNADRDPTQPKLTMLPFLIRGVIAARSAAPQVNARYDDDAGVLSQHDAVHFGIATQTNRGLMVPVLRNAETRSIWALAVEIVRLADAARDGSLSRDELAGSTITVTSLGPLGAVATTPIVNYPEVAIVGVNRKQVRPLWDGRDFVPREVMNVSASFDHRVVDGWDAANFIARLKTLMETPALLFA